METSRKPLNKYWCSVPHYLSCIRNIYIKADRFPFMMPTAANKEILHEKSRIIYIMHNVDVKSHNILVQFCKFLWLTQIHDITEILFKVALNTINLNKSDVSPNLWRRKISTMEKWNVILKLKKNNYIMTILQSAV